MYKFKFLLTVLALGIMSAHAQNYRIIGKSKFQIIDTAGFYIYSLNKLVQGEKIARAENVYYFSVRPDSPLLELSKANLEGAFAENAQFRYAVEAQFSSDKQLMAYDRWLKTYKLKYIYSHSFNRRMQ